MPSRVITLNDCVLFFLEVKQRKKQKTSPSLYIHINVCFQNIFPGQNSQLTLSDQERFMKLSQEYCWNSVDQLYLFTTEAESKAEENPFFIKR